MMPPDKEQRPGAETEALQMSCDGDGPSIPYALDVLTHVQRRCLQDAVNEALAATWERRAAALEWARPLPGDHPGRRTTAQHRAKYDELTAAARACRARAIVARSHVGIDHDVDQALEVVA